MAVRSRKVIIVGGDIPDIKPRLIFDALTALDHVDVVRLAQRLFIVRANLHRQSAQLKMAAIT